MNNNINVKLTPPQGIRVDLKTVYVYDPIIGDATLTIQKNGADVGTFTANSKVDKTVNIMVPTKTSDLTNDKGFITGITSSDITTALGYTPTDDSSLETVAKSGLYSDLTGTPSIPTVNNPTITFTQGGVEKGSITLNQSSNETIALDAGGGGGSSTWGSITGTLSDQTDLKNALDSKVSLDLNNITSTGKSTIIECGIPDYTSGISTSISATNSYTAPSKGFVVMCNNNSQTPGGININGVDIQANLKLYCDGQYFVDAGDVIKTSATTIVIKFYPVKGV